MTVGGAGLFAGPIVGTSALLIIPEIFRHLREYVPFIFAGILLLVLFLMPQGLAGLPNQIKRWREEHPRKAKKVDPVDEVAKRAA
jgi:ABC-type branched-subunit amino acid transport system permease subunit